MSTDSSYRLIKDLPIGNTVAAIRCRQLVATADGREWTLLTFDLSQPPLFHNLIEFMEEISRLKHSHICEICHIVVDGSQMRVRSPTFAETLTERIAKKRQTTEDQVLRWIFQIAGAFNTVLKASKFVFDNLGPLDTDCCIICDQDDVSVNILELWLRGGIDPSQTVDLTTAVSWAPEYLRWEQENHDGKFTGVVDEKGQIWALGVVAYNAAMMTSPFVSNAPLMLMDKIVREIPSVSDRFSESFRDLLSKKLLAKQPDDRISLQELLDHPLICRVALGGADDVAEPLPIISNPAAPRVMVAEQREVSQPEFGEALEVMGTAEEGEESITISPTLSSSEPASSCHLL